MENNFKTTKDTISRIIFESHNTGDKNLTSIYKLFLTEVKKSPILKTLYIVYNNVENTKFEDKDTAEIFLNENLFSFGSFSKKQIIEENNRIKDVIGNQITTASEDKLFDLILESTKDRKLSNLHKKAELFNTISNTLLKEEVKITEPLIKLDSAVINRAIEIINEKYSFFNEDEQGILRAFLQKDENKKKEYFETLISENIKYIRRKLVENDSEDDELEKLLILTEEKFTIMNYQSDTPIKQFSDLISFQKD